MLHALVTALRGHLPTGLARWYPATRGDVGLRDVADHGLLRTAQGRYRAVLRLWGEALDDDRRALPILQQLAGGINATQGDVVLLAYGRPGSLAHALQRAQERANRLAAQQGPVLPAGASSGPEEGRLALARSRVAHLTRLVAGDSGQAPVRRYGWYLVVEASTARDLGTRVREVGEAWHAELVTGAEAVAIETEAWRGMRLPPASHTLLWRKDDPEGAELHLGPRGATVRTGMYRHDDA